MRFGKHAEGTNGCVSNQVSGRDGDFDFLYFQHFVSCRWVAIFVKIAITHVAILVSSLDVGTRRGDVIESELAIGADEFFLLGCG